jgi:hypothetical protein
MKLLQAPINLKAMDEVIFEINPAFWLGLEIE